MKKLTDILKNTPVREVCGDTAAAIGGLVYDSRAVKPGDCFFAVPGTQSDGHDYIPIAVEKGAAAIVCERMPADAAEGVAYVLVGDSAGAMADMAAAFYDYPSRELKLVGITGTNGKTTTATLLYDLVRAMGYKAGLISTVVYKIDGRELVLNIKSKEEVDLPWGGKLQFYSAIVGGAIDARFMPAILKGIMEKMDEGPLTGSYARDIRVVIYDGKMHPVDSNEISFKLAARNAFKEAFRNAGPKIMEPIYSVEVLGPSEYMGAVMSDLQNRRAMIAGMESDKGFDRLNARVPLAELYRYSTTLSSLSSGAATYTMKFASYEQVPADVQDKLLKAYTDTDEE